MVLEEKGKTHTTHINGPDTTSNSKSRLLRFISEIHNLAPVSH